jgi:hypothetical protein
MLGFSLLHRDASRIQLLQRHTVQLSPLGWKAHRQIRGRARPLGKLSLSDQHRRPCRGKTLRPWFAWLQVFPCRPGHRRSSRCCHLPEVIKAYRLKQTPRRLRALQRVLRATLAAWACVLFCGRSQRLPDAAAMLAGMREALAHIYSTTTRTRRGRSLVSGRGSSSAPKVGAVSTSFGPATPEAGLAAWGRG